ncbi:MAG: CoA transferase [bacterium]
MTTTRQDAAGLPYAGIRVVDFSRLLPGGWCSQMLADCGAEVIKVEHPDGGDYSRQNPPHFKTSGVYYNGVNRNKRSVTIDLKTPAGQAAVRPLLEGADVVLESFRTGVAARLGIGYESVKAYNPGVIHCAITGFGQTGSLADKPGHDLNIQGLTGLMGVGLKDGELPRVPGLQGADYAGATMACIGIMAALARRAKSGEGCCLDISMFDSLLSMCNIVSGAAISRLAGGSGEPALQSWGGNPRYAVYATSDGKAVTVSLLETKFWRMFCQAIGRPELVDENEGPEARLTDHGDNSALYRQAVADHCARHARDDLVRNMHGLGIPVFPVLDPDEALQQGVVRERGMLEEIDHPLEGPIPQLGNPLSLAGLARTRRLAAPELGADNETILGRSASPTILGGSASPGGEPE